MYLPVDVFYITDTLLFTSLLHINHPGAMFDMSSTHLSPMQISVPGLYSWAWNNGISSRWLHSDPYNSPFGWDPGRRSREPSCFLCSFDGAKMDPRYKRNDPTDILILRCPQPFAPLHTLHTSRTANTNSMPSGTTWNIIKSFKWERMQSKLSAIWLRKPPNTPQTKNLKAEKPKKQPTISDIISDAKCFFGTLLP